MADLNPFNKHFQQEVTCEKQQVLLKSTRIIFTKQKYPKRSVAVTITGHVEFTGSEYVQVRTRQFLDDLKIMCSVISTLFNKEQKLFCLSIIKILMFCSYCSPSTVVLIIMVVVHIALQLIILLLLSRLILKVLLLLQK